MHGPYKSYLLDSGDLHDLVELVVVEEVVDPVDGGDVLLQRKRPRRIVVGLGSLQNVQFMIMTFAFGWAPFRRDVLGLSVVQCGPSAEIVGLQCL